MDLYHLPDDVRIDNPNMS